MAKIVLGWDKILSGKRGAIFGLVILYVFMAQP